MGLEAVHLRGDKTDEELDSQISDLEETNWGESSYQYAFSNSSIKYCQPGNSFSMVPDSHS